MLISHQDATVISLMTDVVETPRRPFLPHQGPTPAWRSFREVWVLREVVWNIASSQIVAHYHGSFLGVIWSVLNPLMMLAVYAVIFGHFIGRSIDHYALYLITGMVPFIFFMGSCTVGCRSFVQGEVYLRRVYLPKLLFPTVTTIVLLVTFLCTFIAIMFLLPLLEARLSVHWISLPVSIGVLAVFCYGVVLTLATVNVFVRDLEHVLTAIMRALYFLTPIIYKTTPDLPRPVIIINTYNPMTYFLNLFRAPMYDNTWPAGFDVGLCAGMAVVMLFIGIAILRRFEGRIIYAL